MVLLQIKYIINLKEKQIEDKYLYFIGGGRGKKIKAKRKIKHISKVRE